MEYATSNLTYGWKIPGLYKISADVAVKEIEQCKTPDGVVQIKSIISRAEPSENPLHGEFEWNNEKAAYSWRLEQARALLRNIVTVVIKDNGKPSEHIRAYASIREGAENENGDYKHIIEVMETPELTNIMLRNARRELESFKRKYAALTELTTVIKSIDSFLNDEIA